MLEVHGLQLYLSARLQVPLFSLDSSLQWTKAEYKNG